MAINSQRKLDAVETFLAYLNDYFDRAEHKSKQAVAREAGISRVYLHDLVAGNKTNVSLDVAARIATATDTTLGTILETGVLCG